MDPVVGRQLRPLPDHAQFFRAVKANDVKTAQAELGRGVDVEERTEFDGMSMSALLIASCEGYRDLLCLLLAFGADIEARDRLADSDSSESDADGDGSLEDGSLSESFGRTAIMLAAGKGRVECLRLLLDRGANIEASDLSYWNGLSGTALVLAAQAWYTASDDDQLECLRLLLDHGADIEADDGQTALLHVVERNNVEGTRLLLDYGADTEVRHICNGSTPLMVAAEQADGYDELQMECFRLLLDRGANIEATDQLVGQTVLMRAAQSRDPRAAKESIGLLLDRGANIDAADNLGCTAICYSVVSASGSVNLTRFLLERGADPSPAATAKLSRSRMPPLDLANVRTALELLRRREDNLPHDRDRTQTLALMEDDAATFRLRRPWLWTHRPDILAIRMIARRHLRLVVGPDMKQQEADMYGDLRVLSPDLLSDIARVVLERYR